LISNIDASEPTYALYKESMNFTISLKAFPERPKKQFFLLENLVIQQKDQFLQ
jgi:hypothetical protein